MSDNKRTAYLLCLAIAGGAFAFAIIARTVDYSARAIAAGLFASALGRFIERA